MFVLSNNSPKEIGNYNTRENASDHLLRILRDLEEIIRGFSVTVENHGDSSTVTIQDKKNRVHREPLRIISLILFSKPKSYVLNLYHQFKDNKNPELIYEIKVKGNYELKTLKNNLEKLIKGRNLTHHPRFYPF
jgi:hypothetical protein